MNEADTLATGAIELFQDEEWDGPIDVVETTDIFGDLDKPSYERPRRETALADEQEESNTPKTPTS